MLCASYLIQTEDCSNATYISYHLLKIVDFVVMLFPQSLFLLSFFVILGILFHHTFCYHAHRGILKLRSRWDQKPPA